jgi:hypothetical protein
MAGTIMTTATMLEVMATPNLGIIIKGVTNVFR